MPRPRRESNAPRSRSPFSNDCRFHRGDAPDAGKKLGYAALKPWILATGTELISDGLPKPVRPAGDPGGKISFVKPSFNDQSWRLLNLPHDFGIEGPFTQELPGETAKLPWQGVGWYRKRFKLTRADAARRIWLEIDGAMAYSTFWLNGRLVGGWPYGYSSFRLDLTPYATFGGENVLAVRLDNPPNSSRWYPGSGLYRHMWLTRVHPVHVTHHGTFVTTPRIEPHAATTKLDVTVENEGERELELTLDSTFHELDDDDQPKSKPVAIGETFKFTLKPGQQAQRTHSVEITRPKLWSLEKRHRYAAITTVRAGKRLLDRVVTHFGVRSVRADPDDGFWLNDQRVQLQGVCMHSDLGALGTAAHPAGIARQLRILQEMGVNAIRTSHNPPAPELLDLCDKMGFLVMDEAFDCWRLGKKHPDGTKEGDPGFRYQDYAPVFDDWHERDLRLLVRRDRNHPSVVMWSIGNEVIEQWHSDGWKLSTRLAGIVREEDRTRPITSAFNGEQAAYSGFQTALDVVGFNYKPDAYPRFKKSNPSMPCLGSETASTISSRGEYFFPVLDDKHHGKVNFHVSSYDLSTARWAVIPDNEFKGLDEAPYAAGEFVWTGFDYLGEPTPYNNDVTNLLNFSDPEERAKMAKELERLGKIQVPSRSSYFGIVDLAGFPKDRFYIYQARWRPKLKMAHIVPHWNWPERLGEITPVHVYSTGDEAELFLNGRSLGKKRRGPKVYRFRWDNVVYEPGELRVVTRLAGKPWATAVCRTTGPATQLVLEADRSTLRADGADLCFVTARVSDAKGQVVPRSHPLIQFSVQGPAEIIAVDNGDPTSFEPFIATRHRAFNGLCLAVLRMKPKAGPIRLEAESEGLKAGELALRSRA